MASSSSRRKGSARRFDELLALLLLSAAVVVVLALATFDGGDPTWFHHQAVTHPFRNWVGRFGATLGESLLQLLGTVAVLVPAVLLVAAWNRLRGRPALAPYGRSAALAAMGLALLSLVDLLFGEIDWGGARFAPGGYLGAKIAGLERAVLNTPGALIFSATVVAGILLLVTRFSLARLLESAAGTGVAGLAAVRARARGVLAGLRTRRTEAPSRPVAAPPTSARRPSIELEAPPPVPSAAAPGAEPKIVPTAATPAGPKPAPRPRQAALPLDDGRDAGGGYALPPLELLRDPEPQQGEDEKELLERAELLTRKFREFAVEGTVVAIHPGPVVTTFEFKPDAGVKYSKITTLVDDLCLALKAESVRIDRLPGKSTVGIEVPNRHQEIIFPKELIGSDKFTVSKSKLTLALGKDIGGEVYVTQLDRMPHLLIAGATGAGKSVGLNGMIASLLYKATPADVRFIMIDTKMIELGLYADIPHLLVPVVTEPKKASAALKWAVREMELRYRMLASVGVRNISQFNDALKKEPGRTMTNERTGEQAPLKHLPYLVIVIDEMADLMMVSSADVEESIMRLAQMARAVGIHLILATQRPSVDVITGTIKANFPSRIAFRVSQRVDSRTIIDQQGAEHLLGRGDMLFLPPGMARLIRLHGGFITEAELNRIVTFLKKTARPIYDESVLKEPDEDRPDYVDDDRDEFFLRAVEVVLNEGQCSITLIQRRLKLGYARAARIVDSMEQAGIVGPADGSKPRPILVGPEILETLQAER